MRFVLTILLLFLSTNVFASDFYEYNVGSEWKVNEYINKHVLIKVAPKIKFKNTLEKMQLINQTFNYVEREFFKFQRISSMQCEFGNLEVRIISEHDLSNNEYFPSEYFVSKDGDFIIIGRYFEKTNILYVVPPYLGLYYWRKNFAHELMHYFYDDCGITFLNIDIEHKVIDQFLKINRRFFY